MNTSLAEKLNTLPNHPGVYLFKNIMGKIIYVGKAKNLKNRVGSYFHINVTQETKTGALVSRINDVDFVEVESEFDALLLEAELIKKYKPKYNVIQKDDKTYLYIVIRPEAVNLNFRKIIVPKVLTVRQTDLMHFDQKFGPYPDGTTARFIMRTLRKLIPYRDCSATKFNTYHKKGRPCLYGDLGLCSAPCVHYLSTDLKEYKKHVGRISRILRGGSFTVLTELQRLMRKYARERNYEQAAYYRDLVSKFEYVRRQVKSPQRYIENPMLTDDIADDALNALVALLPFLTKTPTRIECYDISNISGTDAVGSMVVAVKGKITKKEYKKFRIKFKKTPDDFEMLYEVISRRLQHHPNIAKGRKVWQVPDLLLIDGGKGQVSAVMAAVEHLGLAIPVIGLAKKEETLVFNTSTTKNIANLLHPLAVADKQDNKFIELKLDKTNIGLKLLIMLRDEAHRFAKAYHHKLRTKTLIG